jgi:hypothetical protein
MRRTTMPIAQRPGHGAKVRGVRYGWVAGHPGSRRQAERAGTRAIEERMIT